MSVPNTLYKPGELAKLLKISRETLRLWAQKGFIQSIVTEGGHRRYVYDLARASSTHNDHVTIAYVSVDKKEELDKHMKSLKERYPGYAGSIVHDIGSCDYFESPTFASIVDKIVNNELNKLIVVGGKKYDQTLKLDILEKLILRCGVTIERI